MLILPPPENGNTYFSLVDTFVNGQPVLAMSYDDAVSAFGQPNSINYYNVSRPTDGESTTLAVMTYDGIDLEIVADSDSSVKAGKIFRYDITGPDYSFCGVTVGMTLENIKAALGGNITVCDAEILKHTITEIEQQYHDSKAFENHICIKNCSQTLSRMAITTMTRLYIYAAASEPKNSTIIPRE